MSKLHNIQRLFCLIDRQLFTNGTLDYPRTAQAIRKLAEAVRTFDGDHNDLWNIGEFESCPLSDLIVGAYWHFAEWHGGQWSPGYAALCALGDVFSPGMSGPEPDNAAYLALETMANGVEPIPL